ncbi:MAG TPA: hypothetical protein VIL37_02465 [Natronosporangium sp.]
MVVLPQIDDDTAEALLTGQAVPDYLQPVAEVLQAYRELATLPVRPSTELTHQMAVGVFTEPAEAHPVVRRRWRSRLALPRPAGRGARHRRRGRPGRLAAIGVAGAVGAGLVGVATAGFAGALPDQTQQRFEQVVEAVTPYEFPRSTGGAGEPGDCPPERSLCGPEVAEDARDGGVDGGEISERARQQGNGNQPADPGTATGPPPDVPGPAGPEPAGPGPAKPEPPAPGPGGRPDPPGNDQRPTAPPGG